MLLCILIQIFLGNFLLVHLFISHTKFYLLNIYLNSGFAFVNFETFEDSERAINELNNSVLDGKTIVVERAKRNRPHEKTPGRCNNLYYLYR